VHRVAVDIENAAAVVAASGELDAYAAPDLETELEGVRGEPRIVVDLSQVSFLDSTALGLLVRFTQERARDGADVRIVVPAGPARRIFEITALDRILPLADTRLTAVAELTG
jgi:anti-sigma B factor antagonist